MKIKRYRPVLDRDGIYFKKDPKGEWVSYQDHAERSVEYGCNKCGAHSVCRCKAEEPVKPKFKLFEIDWKSTYPAVTSEWGQCFPSVGAILGQYRIFGFDSDGLDEFDAESLKTYIRQKNYDTHPSDHTGNRKYAIGRLEQ